MKTEFAAAPQSVTLPLLQYIHAEQAAGIMLIVGGLIGLIWANTPARPLYHQFLNYHLHLVVIDRPIKDWITDGLLVLVFVKIGLEIKRELVHGTLSSLRNAMLPIAATIGGIVLPATIYFAFNFGTHNVHGWGVPVATDIAFTLGVMALLGKRVPHELKVFLLAFAAADDIVGVVIIAAFYSSHLSWMLLGVSAGIVALIIALRWLRFQNSSVYALLGVGLWLAVLESGVHATIAGVVFGLLVPAKSNYSRDVFRERGEKLMDKIREADDVNEREMYLGRLEHLVRGTEYGVDRLERLLRPWTTYLVLPLFAFSHSGIDLSLHELARAATNRVSLGIFTGLVVGKFLGVGGAAWLAVKLKLARLPERVTSRHMIGVSALAGIGFTVSLFIADLAFDQKTAELAQTAVMFASVTSAVIGMAWLLLQSRDHTTLQL